MIVTIFALEKLIQENQAKIDSCRKQLKDLDMGNITLSAMKIASIENTLEESTKDLEIYQKIYDDIPQEKKDKQKELLRVQEALAKETYYKLQKMRIKRSKNITRDQKLEAMMILDELPDDIHIDDKELLEISQIIIKNNIREVTELENELGTIRDEFNKQIDRLEDHKDLKHLAFLDTYIPIVILHFSVLVQNIQETIEQYNEKITEDKNSDEKIELKQFRGLPNYEDWWIEELFKNHQAYLGLYQWKNIISNECITQQQKQIWEKIFSNWLMVKKILNNKDENGYEYHFIFDQMIEKYAQLDEELDKDNLLSLEKIIMNITSKVDFTKTNTRHNITTAYSQYKTKRLEDSAN